MPDEVPPSSEGVSVDGLPDEVATLEDEKARLVASLTEAQREAREIVAQGDRSRFETAVLDRLRASGCLRPELLRRALGPDLEGTLGMDGKLVTRYLGAEVDLDEAIGIIRDKRAPELFLPLRRYEEPAPNARAGSASFYRTLRRTLGAIATRGVETYG